ncbi:antibiotic biosynthesis monooxygenase family protein [Streptomyces sp. NPDC020917]|uniref:antibiotic biosynthesis monooxygenase family protein n=1 Tax=Streptomyces sp. NPDC020917 TaxID=3365102 RepID=UPI0037AAE832
MFARVQTFHQPAEKLDALAALVQEQLAAAQPPGLKGFQYLIDRDNGKALLISFWDSEEDLRQLEANNAATRERVKEEAGVEAPTAEVFEVTLQDL